MTGDSYMDYEEHGGVQKNQDRTIILDGREVKVGTEKSAHWQLLNRLCQMQDSPYYAIARDTLAEAERLIVSLEHEAKKARNAALEEAAVLCHEMYIDGPPHHWEYPDAIRKLKETP